MNRAKRILKKYNYLVEVQETKKGIFIYTPERTLNYFWPENLTYYDIIVDDINNKYGVLIYSDEIEELFIEIPKYAIATALSLEIDRACLSLQYNVNLISYRNFSGNEVENIILQDKINLNESEQDKEEKLKEIIVKQLACGFSENISDIVDLYGIKEGYAILERLYKGE